MDTWPWCLPGPLPRPPVHIPWVGPGGGDECGPGGPLLVSSPLPSPPQADLEVPIPRYFLSERAKVLQERQEVLGEILARAAPSKCAVVSRGGGCLGGRGGGLLAPGKAAPRRRPLLGSDWAAAALHLARCRGC